MEALERKVARKIAAINTKIVIICMVNKSNSIKTMMKSKKCMVQDRYLRQEHDILL